MKAKRCIEVATTIVALAATAVVGCSEDRPDGPPTTAPGGAGGTGGEGGQLVGGGGSGGSGGALPTITVDGSLFAMPYAPTSVVEGGEVCFVVDGVAAPCTSTDENGAYALAEIPGHTAGGLRFAAPNIATFYWLLVTEEDDITIILAADTPELIASYHEATQIPHDPDGVVVIAELYPKQPGFAATLSPASGEGPYYYETFDGLLDVEATETNAAISLAVFLNVDRVMGPFESGFEKDGVLCQTSTYGADTLPAWTIPDDADVVYASYDCL